MAARFGNLGFGSGDSSSGVVEEIPSWAPGVLALPPPHTPPPCSAVLAVNYVVIKVCNRCCFVQLKKKKKKAPR